MLEYVTKVDLTFAQAVHAWLENVGSDCNGSLVDTDENERKVRKTTRESCIRIKSGQSAPYSIDATYKC